MPILTQPAFGPKLSIGFITGGVLVDVWALVWRFTIAGEELSPQAKFWFYGFLLTGAAFVIIGLLMGNIGRAARKAELPPTTEAVRAEENVQVAAANAGHVAPVVAPAMPAPTMAAPAMPVSRQS